MDNESMMNINKFNSWVTIIHTHIIEHDCDFFLVWARFRVEQENIYTLSEPIFYFEIT
jgi:hypothetical protein